jgi:hypothetical protein
MFIFALIASVDVWRNSAGAARTRARAFTIAFGLRDACWGFVYSSAIYYIWLDLYSVVDPNAAGYGYVIYALGTLLAVPLIAYADALECELQEHPPSVTWLWSASRQKAEVHINEGLISTNGRGCVKTPLMT